MKDKLSVLVLDDDSSVQILLKSYFKKDFIVHLASKPSEAFAIMDEEDIDVLICDIVLPEMNGLDFIQKVNEQYPEPEIIMMSGHTDTEKVIEAMHKGAVDFFKKPLDRQEIKVAIERTRKFAEMEEELKKQKSLAQLLEEQKMDKSGAEIIGRNEKIQELKETIHKIAQTPNTSVLITGESGTGKELVARGIHNLSSRHHQYFGAVNTSAINENLFESEFFGHKKGAFTGADENRAGWFEVADKGTLFLDEIGEMPLELQAKLLRVLEDEKYIPVGGHKEHNFDIRIISATNKDIEKIHNGEYLRPDLFYRLATFEIHVPPLRERKDDIPLLADYFVKFLNKKLNKNIKKISPEAFDLLMSYDFPGNIRELKNLLERAVILSEDHILNKNCFPQISGTENGETAKKQTGNIFDLNKIEKQTIVKALETTDYNMSQAAELLNIKWNALDRRMQKYGLNKKARSRNGM